MMQKNKYQYLPMLSFKSSLNNTGKYLKGENAAVVLHSAFLTVHSSLCAMPQFKIPTCNDMYLVLMYNTQRCQVGIPFCSYFFAVSKYSNLM